MKSPHTTEAAAAADDAADIRAAAEALRGARRVLFVTGAGLSADSGLPTYRGVAGLYTGRPTPEGLPIEEILSGEMFRVRPELTWRYLLEVERACRGAAPNRGHEVIAEMQSHFDAVWVLTQNVDGLHRRAGSRAVIDIHGRLHDLRCQWCRYRATVPDFDGLTESPKCPDCGGPVRADVVLFGEPLPAAAVADYQRELAAGFDVVFSVGTTSLFPYIAEPFYRAHRRGRPAIEVNPGDTEVTEFASVKIARGAADALDAVWRAYRAGG